MVGIIFGKLPVYRVLCLFSIHCDLKQWYHELAIDHRFFVYSVGNETNQLQKSGEDSRDNKQINQLQEMVFILNYIT